MGSVRTDSWLFRSENDKRIGWLFVRSPYRRSARNKCAFISAGHGFVNWEEKRLTKKDIAELPTKYEYDTLYEVEKEKANSCINGNLSVSSQ